MANVQNLKPKPFTKENAKEMGARGGKKKAENAKERVLMSEIYSQFIAEHKAELEESLKKVTMRGDASTVSLMAELRKGTEGDKVNLSGSIKTEMETTEDRLKAFQKIVQKND